MCQYRVKSGRRNRLTRQLCMPECGAQKRQATRRKGGCSQPMIAPRSSHVINGRRVVGSRDAVFHSVPVVCSSSAAIPNLQPFLPELGSVTFQAGKRYWTINLQTPSVHHIAASKIPRRFIIAHSPPCLSSVQPQPIWSTSPSARSTASRRKSLDRRPTRERRTLLQHARCSLYVLDKPLHESHA